MKVTANVMADLLNVQIKQKVKAIREGERVRGIELTEAKKHINDSTIYFMYEGVMKFIRKYDLLPPKPSEPKKNRRHKINERKMKNNLKCKLKINEIA